MLEHGYMVLTSEFFESRRLTFEFAGLEQIVGLCILELDPTQKDEEIWRESFERKLGTLRRDLASTAKHIPRWSPNMARLEELLATAMAVGRTRNTIVHGTLHYHAGGELLLKNRAYGGTYAVDATGVDALTAEGAQLYDRFVDVRSKCVDARLLGSDPEARLPRTLRRYEDAKPQLG